MGGGSSIPGGYGDYAGGGPGGNSHGHDPTKYIPAGYGGAASSSGGGDSPQATFTPSSAKKFQPYMPPKRPPLGLPPTANGTFNGTDLELSFSTTDAFLNGFVGSVEVEPWLPGAVLVLDYSGSDVAVQRLWNGDVIDDHGTAVKPYDLLTGKSGQTYIVRLHDKSIMSSYGSPDNSISFMAFGTAQAPAMTVGCPWLEDATEDSPQLEYAVSTSWPGGFIASVTVRPWVVGKLIEVAYTGGGVHIGRVWRATLVRAQGGQVVVRLGNLTKAPDKDKDEMAPDNAFGFVAFGDGDGVEPVLTDLGLDDDGAEADEPAADSLVVPSLSLVAAAAPAQNAGGESAASVPGTSRVAAVVGVGVLFAAAAALFSGRFRLTACARGGARVAGGQVRLTLSHVRRRAYEPFRTVRGAETDYPEAECQLSAAMLPGDEEAYGTASA